MQPWLEQLDDPAIDASWPLRLLLNGVSYYSLNGTNMLALREAIASVPTSVPLAASGSGDSGGGAATAAIAAGVGGAIVFVALLAAAMLLLRRRRARARLAASAKPPSRRKLNPLAASSGNDKWRALSSDTAADGAGEVVNPLRRSLAGSLSSGAGTPRAAAASSRIVVSPLAGAEQSRERAAAREATEDSVNPLFQRTAIGSSVKDGTAGNAAVVSFGGGELALLSMRDSAPASSFMKMAGDGSELAGGGAVTGTSRTGTRAGADASVAARRLPGSEKDRVAMSTRLVALTDTALADSTIAVAATAGAGEPASARAHSRNDGPV
jgi:hypothetical protein